LNTDIDEEDDRDEDNEDNEDEDIEDIKTDSESVGFSPLEGSTTKDLTTEGITIDELPVAVPVAGFAADGSEHQEPIIVKPTNLKPVFMLRRIRPSPLGVHNSLHSRFGGDYGSARSGGRLVVKVLMLVAVERKVGAEIVGVESVEPF